MGFSGNLFFRCRTTGVSLSHGGGGRGICSTTSSENLTQHCLWPAGEKRQAFRNRLAAIDDPGILDRYQGEPRFIRIFTRTADGSRRFATGCFCHSDALFRLGKIDALLDQHPCVICEHLIFGSIGVDADRRSGNYRNARVECQLLYYIALRVCPKCRQLAALPLREKRNRMSC